MSRNTQAAAQFLTASPPGWTEINTLMVNNLICSLKQWYDGNSYYLYYYYLYYYCIIIYILLYLFAFEPLEWMRVIELQWQSKWQLRALFECAHVYEDTIMDQHYPIKLIDIVRPWLTSEEKLLIYEWGIRDVSSKRIQNV